MMKYLNHKSSDNPNSFIKNEKAVLGLPMRLTVSIIIGTIALAAILAYILNPCLFPSKVMVTVYPMVNTMPRGQDSNTFDITIYVNETDGHPIKDANVILKGLGGIGSNSTNKDGKTTIHISVELESGINEGYLDVSVKVPCHETFSHQDMIKVVREL